MFLQFFIDKKYRLVKKERFDNWKKELKKKMKRIVNIVKSKTYDFYKVPANPKSLDIGTRQRL